MVRPYLKIWEWELIFGRAVKAISSLGVRSPWFRLSQIRYSFFLAAPSYDLDHLCLRHIQLRENYLFFYLDNKNPNSVQFSQFLTLSMSISINDVQRFSTTFDDFRPPYPPNIRSLPSDVQFFGVILDPSSITYVVCERP